MAEFAMVIVLLMVLFLALVGVALWAYGHSLLTNAAGQAARFAANADISDPVLVSERAGSIMAGTVFGALANSVHCEAPTVDGGITIAAPADDGPVDDDEPSLLPAMEAPLVEVRCVMDAPLPLPFLADVLPAVEVSAHALREAP